MNCRYCQAPLSRRFLDLGDQPPANHYLTQDQLQEPENFYPLSVYVCDGCLLVQLSSVRKAAETFAPDYPYFSSYAPSWVEHARRYVEMMLERFSLNRQSFVVEIASNDGYLLQHFHHHGIPCLGIDPAAAAAAEAEKKSIRTLVEFFDDAFAGRLAETEGQADLIVGNNVFAHVPDPGGFVKGLGTLLKPEGIITLEFPHVAKLIEFRQFDTIYDEHVSYYSLGVVQRMFADHGLEVFDVEQLETHGGSLRVFGRHIDACNGPVGVAVEDVTRQERELGLDAPEGYGGFQAKVDEIRDQFLDFMRTQSADGKRIAAFGAAAKGSSFLNYCGIGAEAIEFVADDTPAKQGKFLPKSHIPVVPADEIRLSKPDIILILPWNLKAEIMDRLSYVREWGGRFVTCIPEIEIF